MPPHNGPTSQPGANLAYTKFLFVTPCRDDEAARVRLLGAGSIIARGFFNDFDTDGTREAQTQPYEAIQFLTTDHAREGTEGIRSARYVAHVTARYRARLDDVESELRRRLGDWARVVALNGAVREPRYTSAELHAYAYKPAIPRGSGRVMRNAIILPIRKTREWWQKTALERHVYFYPHADLVTAGCAKGHARAAEAGIGALYRRLYHNPDGYQREGEWDFITYFECADEHVVTFEQVCQALRDERQNPEWRYVIEGPEWRGKRVLRW